MVLSRIEKAFYWAGAACFLMPILPNVARNILVAILLVVVIIGLFDKKSSVKPDYKFIILSSLLYISYAVSLLYTENLAVGFKKLETGSTLLLIPLIFGLAPQNTIFKFRENLDKLLSIYVYSTALAFVLFFIYFWPQYQMTLLIHFPTVMIKDLGPYNIHPIYICMHGGISLLFALYLISKKSKHLLHTLLIILASVVITLFMLLLVKKGPIISLVLAGGYLAFTYKNKFIIGGLALLCLLFVGLISFNKDANSKFSELLTLGKRDQTTKSVDQLSSTNIRMAIYACAKTAIPNAGFIGYGVGDAQTVLTDCYATKNSALLESEYNSHNQYLSILLRSGVLGLMAFSIYIIFLINTYYRSRAFIAIAVMMFYLFVMFSENILERENGVVYFSFFTSFLYFICKPIVPANILNEES